MTIVTTLVQSGPYIAVAQTTFAVTFQSASATEIEVLNGDTVVASSAYTFTRNADGTGSVVFTVPVTGTILIRTNPNYLQPTAFNKFGAFYPDLINGPLDRAAARDLHLLDKIGKTSGGLSTGVAHTDTFGSASYLKTTSDIINGMPVDFFRFVSQSKVAGIRGRTDTSDLTADFATAMAAGAAQINLQPGLYNTTGSIALSTTGKSLRGAGPEQTEIKIASTTADAITLANGVAGYNVGGLKVTRTGVPEATACGVKCLGTTDKSIIEWMAIEDHYDNLVIGTCDTGFIHNLELRRAYRHGWFQTNSAVYGASQWNVNGVLVERSASDGALIQSTLGVPGMILGQYRAFRTFANGGYGVNFNGSAATPVHGVDIDGFSGSDALGCLRLNTFAGYNRVTGTYERAGMDATGRTLATPASMAAPNILVTVNNLDVGISARIDTGSYDGIEHGGGTLMLDNCTIVNNGQALAVGRRRGINSSGGTVLITGGKYGNVATSWGGAVGTAQENGVSGADGNNIKIVAAQMVAHSISNYSATLNNASIYAAGIA